MQLVFQPRHGSYEHAEHYVSGGLVAGWGGQAHGRGGVLCALDWVRDNVDCRAQKSHGHLLGPARLLKKMKFFFVFFLSFLGIPDNHFFFLFTMTIVSAIVDGSVCIFSCDSGSFSEESVSLRSNAKLFKKTIEGAGECLIGFAGLFALCQWIKYLEFPSCPEHVKSFEQYLVQYLQPFLLKSLSKRWKLNRDMEHTTDIGDYCLLLGFQGNLFTLYSNGDVEKAQAYPGMYCFASIGSGGESSNAAMYAIQNFAHANKDNKGAESWALPSWEILEAGIGNAERTTIHVKGPFSTQLLYS